MLVKEIMTKNIKVIERNSSSVEAARLMKDLNVGALPVGDESKIVGLITDRDIVIKIIAEGRNPKDCKVDEVMSKPIEWIAEDRTIEEASRLMADHKIRRLIVMDRNQKPVGFLALGDVATRSNGENAQEVLQNVSEPSHPAH